MAQNNRDDYVVLFKGAKLSKQEANKVGLGIICGVIGIVISLFTLGVENKFVSLIIISIFALFGYFVLANRIFKK